jgi:hypothetical protein
MTRQPEDAPLWYWMMERMSIWDRRNRGEPKPWTDDPILQRFRFCNVFRELDVVTQWIAENIRTPFHDHEHLWFMLAIARTINHPPTLEELILGAASWPSSKDFTPQAMTAVLQARKDRKDQVYTGAYMIRAESNPKAPWYSWTKQRYIAEIVLGRLWEDRKKISEELEAAKSLEETWALLAKQPYYIGWGPFMAYEWVTDLRWTRYLKEASDKMTWANAGPGALRGLARLGTEDKKLPKKVPSPEEACRAMRALLQRAPKFLPTNMSRALEMRDVEHSLCEMDKYLRVYHGEGEPRAKYRGTP